MRYTLILILCVALFAQCSRNIDVYPTSTYDTLGVQWMTIQRDNIEYYFQGNGVEAASLYTDMHEDAYTRLLPVFEPVLPRKLRFFVWTDRSYGEQALSGSVGFANPIECVCHVRANQTLGHEMTHIMSYWAWGIEPTTYSRFIDEGLAVAFDLRDDDDRVKTAKKALNDYSLNSIRELWLDTQNSAPAELLYPVGGAFMDYLYKLNETEKFKALVKNQTLEDAENIYGKERLDALIADFDSLLGLR